LREPRIIVHELRTRPALVSGSFIIQHMVAPAISFPERPIAEFCRRWKITELAAFGSVVRGDFRPDSDVDLLASFASDADWSLLDALAMEEELSSILGRTVDLVSRRAIERSDNWIRRREILGSAVPVYAVARHRRRVGSRMNRFDWSSFRERTATRSAVVKR